MLRVCDARSVDVAADLRHRRGVIEHELVRAVDAHGDDQLAQILQREGAVEQADEGAEGAGRVVVLGAAEQQRAATLKIPQIHIVTERRSDDGSARR